MSTPLDDIEAQVMALSPAQRAELMERLLTQEASPSLGPEWQAEIARRVADMEAGRTTFIPAEEAMAQLAAHIQSRRTSA